MHNSCDQCKVFIEMKKIIKEKSETIKKQQEELAELRQLKMLFKYN